MRPHTRTFALVGLLAGALVLTACGNSDDPTVGGAADTESSSENANFNDQDRQFAAGMVPHHSQAVDMSEMILNKNPSESVAKLAEQIKAAQQPEIDELNEMLETFGDELDSGDHGGHGGGSDTAEHGGMMTDAQMQELMAASGADAERMFLTMMIAHHKGAIEAAETELADGQYAPALELAERIKADQVAEITEMEQLLTQL